MLVRFGFVAMSVSLEKASPSKDYTYTSGLSTWWSSRGLILMKGWERVYPLRYCHRKSLSKLNSLSMDVRPILRSVMRVIISDH